MNPCIVPQLGIQGNCDTTGFHVQDLHAMGNILYYKIVLYNKNKDILQNPGGK
jgi:hypothetical protein